MEKTELKTILKAYYLSLDDYNLSKLGHGHIHQTLLVEPLNAIKKECAKICSATA